MHARVVGPDQVARGRNQTDFCGYRGKKNIFYPVNEYGEIGILKGDGYGTL
jgi:hypothetical protein